MIKCIMQMCHKFFIAKRAVEGIIIKLDLLPMICTVYYIFQLYMLLYKYRVDCQGVVEIRVLIPS